MFVVKHERSRLNGPNRCGRWAVMASGKQGEEPSAKRQLIKLLFAGSVYRITIFRRGLGLVWFRVPIMPDLPTIPTALPY